MSKKNSKEAIELFKSNNFKAIIFYHILDPNHEYKVTPTDTLYYKITWYEDGVLQCTNYQSIECICALEEADWIITEIEVTNDIYAPNN